MKIDSEMAVMGERMNQFTEATAIRVGKEVIEAQNARAKAVIVMSTAHAK